MGACPNDMLELSLVPIFTTMSRIKYRMSKKSCIFVYSEYSIKNGQDFLGMHVVHILRLSLHIYHWYTEGVKSSIYWTLKTLRGRFGACPCRRCWPRPRDPVCWGWAWSAAAACSCQCTPSAPRWPPGTQQRWELIRNLVTLEIIRRSMLRLNWDLKVTLSVQEVLTHFI